MTYFFSTLSFLLLGVSTVTVVSVFEIKKLSKPSSIDSLVPGNCDFLVVGRDLLVLLVSLGRSAVRWVNFRLSTFNVGSSVRMSSFFFTFSEAVINKTKYTTTFKATNMGLVTRKSNFTACKQRRHRPACMIAQSDHCLC